MGIISGNELATVSVRSGVSMRMWLGIDWHGGTSVWRTRRRRPWRRWYDGTIGDRSDAALLLLLLGCVMRLWRRMRSLVMLINELMLTSSWLHSLNASFSQ